MTVIQTGIMGVIGVTIDVGPSRGVGKMRVAGSTIVGATTIAEVSIPGTIGRAAGCKLLRKSSVSFLVAADTGLSALAAENRVG